MAHYVNFRSLSRGSATLTSVSDLLTFCCLSNTDCTCCFAVWVTQAVEAAAKPGWGLTDFHLLSVD